jgi:predicted permease
MNVAEQVLVLFLLIVIGYAARKIKAIDDAAVGHFTSFVLNLSLPALILASFQQPFSRALLGEAGIVLALSFGVYAASFAVAAVYPSIIRVGRKERGVHRYGIIFSNVGFMGFPVVEAVLGRDALFHLAIFNIPFNLLAFSIGAWLISREGERPLTMSWRTFINPSVVAAIIGFLCFLFSFRYPQPLFRVLKMTGDITSPLSMIVIGAILARMDPRRVVGRWRNYATTIVRLILMPAGLFFALRVLGFRGTLLVLPTLIAAMPIAANTTILADFYGGDTESASALVFISTLLCVVTIPAVVAFATAF